MTHVPYPGCYCADCVENPSAPQPVGWICAEMLKRTREFEANGIVMFDRPCGMARMPVYAEPPSARITGDKDRENPVEGAPHDEGLIGRIAELEREVDQLRRSGDRLSAVAGRQMRAKHEEQREAKLWFDRAQQWRADNRRLSDALRWIADTAYIDQQSGNQNFEHLQSIARDELAKEPTQ